MRNIDVLRDKYHKYQRTVTITFESVIYKNGNLYATRNVVSSYSVSCFLLEKIINFCRPSWVV